MSRRRTHAAACLAAIVVAVLLGAATAPPALAGAAGATRRGQVEPNEAPGATIRLIDQTDVSVPDGDFAAFFEVEGVPAGSYLVVDLYPRIRDQAQLDAAASGRPHNSSVTFDPVPLTGDPAVAPVQTGFVIDLTRSGQPRGPCCWSRRLTEPGVYPVKVQLREPGGKTVRTMVTYLLRAPEADQHVDATRVALLASLRTHDARDDADTPLPVSDTAGVERIAATLAQHASVPASFSLTPESVVRLAGASESATTYAGLRAALQGEHRELLGAPYVDIDPAALVRADLADEIARQADLGRRALTDRLEAPAPGTWSLDRPVDAGTVDALERLGVRQVLLPRSAVGTQPDGPVRLAGATDRTRALIRDPIDRVGTAVDDPILAARQLVGRLAALGSIRSGTSRVLDVDIATADAAGLGAVLDALTTPGPFLDVNSVSGLFDAAPTVAARASLTKPSGAGLGAYPDHLRRARDLLSSYATMIPDRPDLVTAYSEPLARTAAANLDIATRIDRTGRIEAQLTGQFTRISIPAKDRVTLGARDAQFPLPVRSSLGVPVHVLIELDASDRLAFPRKRFAATLDSGRTLIQIQVRTRATGDTPLRITVRSPDGAVVLAEGRYSVRSTAVSGVGLLLTIGAAAFLALWWGRHWIRNRRRARHARGRFRRHHPPAPSRTSVTDDEVMIDHDGVIDHEPEVHPHHLHPESPLAHEPAASEHPATPSV